MRDVLERSDDDLLSQLKELLAAQFVVEESDDRFAFRHALAREAIYKSLLGRERVALHRRIGNYLAAHNRAPSALTSAGELAYHFYEGQVWQLAFDFATAAGSDALALYAPRAAVEQYSRALTAAEHLQIPSGPIRLLRGRAHAMRSEF
jgi:predicted ATPase